MGEYVPVKRPAPWRWRHESGYSELQDADGGTILYAEKGEEALQACNLDLIAAAPEMAALLRKLEWSGSDNGGDPCCPSCGAPRNLGQLLMGTFAPGAGAHDTGCDLAGLLVRLPKEGA